MAERATASTGKELKCSASKVFRVYMDKLMVAMQLVMPHVVMELFSKEIISEGTRDKVLFLNLTTLEKNAILLTAVEDAIKTQPQVLFTLLDILNKDNLNALVGLTAMIAQEMRQQLGMLKINVQLVEQCMSVDACNLTLLVSSPDPLLQRCPLLHT